MRNISCIMRLIVWHGMNRLYQFYQLAAMLIFGTIPLFVRSAGVSSALLALLRTMIGACVLGLVLLGKHRHISIEKGQGKYLLLSALFLGCNWVFLFESYHHTSVSNATIAYYTAPILIMVLSAVLFHIRLRKKDLGCLGLTMLGLILITFQNGDQNISGILFGLLAAMGYAGVVLTNRMIHMESIGFTFIQLGIAALLLFPYVLSKGELTQLTTLTMSQLPSILILGIVHTGIAYLLYFASIAKLPPTRVAIFSYLDPCTAIVLSIFVLQEPSSRMQIIGIIMIFMGIFLSSYHAKGSEQDVL